jgi:Sec-independent protein translocase protein TatA
VIAGIEVLVVAVVLGAIFFFGRGKVMEWAKTAGEAKKAFDEASKPTEKKE